MPVDYYERELPREIVVETESEKAFARGKQNWFVCSQGFHHDVIAETKTSITMKISCPKCEWTATGSSPLRLAEKEIIHEHICPGRKRTHDNPLAAHPGGNQP